MSGTSQPTSHWTLLRAPWDLALATRSQLQLLRVLERSGEPMSLRELGRRSGLHLRSIQNVQQRLLESGLCEMVGSSARQLIRYRAAHPLAGVLSQLFDAEEERCRRILRGLRDAVGRTSPEAQASWLVELQDEHHSWLQLTLVASSHLIDDYVDALREHISPIMQEEDLVIEVRGLSPPDLALLGNDALPPESSVELLGGVYPREPHRAGHGHRAPRSHSEIDEELRERARRIADAIRGRKELVEWAREEVERRLQEARARDQKVWQEWQHILAGMRPARLADWIEGESEQSVRLRQSMPQVFLEATVVAEDDGQG